MSVPSVLTAALLQLQLQLPVPVPFGTPIAVLPERLPVSTGQCNGDNLRLALTNDTASPVFADASITASPELHLPRSLVSTWLPAGYTRTVPLPVSVVHGTPPGDYQVTVVSGTNRIRVPVTVTAPQPSPDLTRSAAFVTASSSRAGLMPCGAVDGDDDPANFGITTGWNDATGKQWPDWIRFDWDTPQQITRVSLTAANTVEFPFPRFGLRDWDIQIPAAGTAWQTVATVRDSTTPLNITTFPKVTTRSLRILTLAGNGVNDQTRVTEIAIF
ncbi:discoidin domain-containing protein [Actinoplanes sp. NPDC051851]|uniref:discoidin domain-containing protein n=1 Tax=Actinoplanes sp. NPDC051851 TaxID=3154753 RepID=UPI00342A5D3F